MRSALVHLWFPLDLPTQTMLRHSGIQLPQQGKLSALVRESMGLLYRCPYTSVLSWSSQPALQRPRHEQ